MPTPLEEFATSQSEDAFRRLVDEFGGLVFTSALRRTGDGPLAEEVTQNVFTILATKAKELARHPSLSGWLFTTTKLESSKAMRARKRHARKIEALAQELPAGKMEAPPDEETWREAIPHLDGSLDRLPKADRELLLARFFEDRSFKDIARDSGKSEAACKMRLKRTLTKLNRWLGAKGVTLSVTTLGAALSAELSKAAPAAITAALPAKAIAAASVAGAGAAAAGGSTIATNLLNTMNAMKTSAAAAAAVLAIGSVPVIIQHSDAKDLKESLTLLQQEKRSIEAKHSGHAMNGTGGKASAGLAAQDSGTPIQRLLSQTKAPVSGDDLMETLQNAMLNQDMTEMLRSFVPLARMSEEELQKLIAEVQASKKNLNMKPMALQLLTGLSQAGEADPGGTLDRHLASSLHPMNMTSEMQQWAKKDPEAALAWFRKNQENGTLHGKGIHNSAEPHLAAALAAELSRTNPDQAIALADEIDPIGRTIVLQRLAEEFVRQGEEGRARAREILSTVTEPGNRRQILGSAVHAMVRDGQRDEVLGFLLTMDLNDAELGTAFAPAVHGNFEEQPVSERMQWVLDHVPDESRTAAVETAVSRLQWSEGAATTQWIDNLPAGADRDTALNAQAMAMMGQSARESALERALLIGDETKRQSAALGILRVWQRANPTSAAEAAQRAGIALPPQSN